MLGAGVIGIEYASIFAALGIAVTLVDTRDSLLPYLDREIVAVLEAELRGSGCRRSTTTATRGVERSSGDPPRVRCVTAAGRTLEADVLLYCVGRDGNTARPRPRARSASRPTAYGLLEVNENYQTVHPHIYAVGDVIGYPALATTSMEQGRQAMRHAFQHPGAAGARRDPALRHLLDPRGELRRARPRRRSREGRRTT